MRVPQHLSAIAVLSCAGLRRTRIMQQQVKTDVFIVRVWREPREASGEPALWRGTVEHVASKAMRHVDQLSEIIDFIEAMAALAGDRSYGAEPKH